MTAPISQAEPLRSDAYLNFRIRLKCAGVCVAGFGRLSVLGPGGATGERLPPGQSSYEPVTLEQGLTHDTAFAQWAGRVWDYRSAQGAGGSVQGDFRKDLDIEIYSEAGQKVLAYNIRRCWISELQALPELDGKGNALAIQALTLQHEGWTPE